MLVYHFLKEGSTIKEKRKICYLYPFGVSLLLTLEVLQQLSSCAIVPNQVWIFCVAIQQLQDLKCTTGHVTLSFVSGFKECKCFISSFIMHLSRRSGAQLP